MITCFCFVDMQGWPKKGNVGIKIDESEEIGEETKMSTLDLGGRRTLETDRTGTNGGQGVASTLIVDRRPFFSMEN